MERDHQTTLPVVLITWCLSVGSISRALAAESQVTGSPQPIVAEGGDDVILPCSLVPPISAEKMKVTWSRPDLNPKYVHVYRDGRDSVGDQNPSYRNRTSLFEGELINGNVSLKLSRVKLEDEGNYSCFIPSFSLVNEAVIQLTVVPVSEPKISVLRANRNGVVLQCEAKSWYPEPQLEWREGPKDSDGRLLSADVTQTDREPDGRYIVRSSVTVQKTDTNMFTCRVQLLKYNLKRETEIHVPGSLIQSPERSSDPSLVVGVGVGVGVGVAVLVIVGAIFLYHHCQKKSTQRAGSSGPDKERGGTNGPGENEQMLSEETRMEIKRNLLQGLDPDTRRTHGRPREGQDSGWASKIESNAGSDSDSLAYEAESNAGSDSDSLAYEHLELKSCRSDN